MSAQKQIYMSGKRHFHGLTPLTVERFPLTDRILTCLVKRGEVMLVVIGGLRLRSAINKDAMR